MGARPTMLLCRLPVSASRYESSPNTPGFSLRNSCSLCYIFVSLLSGFIRLFRRGRGRVMSVFTYPFSDFRVSFGGSSTGSKKSSLRIMFVPLPFHRNRSTLLAFLGFSRIVLRRIPLVAGARRWCLVFLVAGVDDDS